MVISLKSWSQVDGEIKSYRIRMILKAFNSQPEKIIRPLTAADVQLGKYDGRVNVNEKSKFSYFVHIDNVADRNSKITLIPMATSRYTPTYYQTDEWWYAHKNEIAQAKQEGTAAPKQDMNEVAIWLDEMKLSTNPDVIIIDGKNQLSQRVSLQTFLLDHYKKFYVRDGYITLFRGAEKPVRIFSLKEEVNMTSLALATVIYGNSL